MSGLSPYLRLLRPHQWVKNGFVFVGLIFSRGWEQPALVAQVVLAALAFSLAASCIYVFNDLADRERDRQHPAKRHRPIASGAVQAPQAVVLGALCLVAGLALAWQVSWGVLAVVAIYLFINGAYSLGLKHVAVLDVFIIAAGFMLRILAGTLGVGIAPSAWLLLCGLMLTLFLGFAKRRAELDALAGKAGSHRKVLNDYDPAMLDQFITISAGAAIVSYSLYTVAPETVALHGSRYLIYTVPFVVYGIFRYLFLLHRRGGGGDPAAELLRDKHLLVAFLGWLVAVVGLLA
ncbi:decaprenyl-phosphate phosphoribosyltransferase [Azospira inquinata]|uniref:Decaprenyl-phosphate phosphoribosyltransferase n=1 Tax=Azospira inquinata TaxID=2785627 RepID=A0A975XV91_9RHOO|nr:decaprenyl-phosphate phosphoribosyltransferase [Azospira inquinata]QWT45087.1 decaprenyl-phosphate phosphoribosyltransferase [Azospira inquinata]QWT49579.1 decaprenyl-phosphate phosphoribosyltransferase [Azospira inquinata]